MNTNELEETKTQLQEGIARCRALYDKHYGLEPDYGNGPDLWRAILSAERALERGQLQEMEMYVEELSKWSEDE